MYCENNNPAPVLLFKTYFQIVQDSMVSNAFSWSTCSLSTYGYAADIHNRLIVMQLKHFHLLDLFNNVTKMYLYVVNDTFYSMLSLKKGSTPCTYVD